MIEIPQDAFFVGNCDAESGNVERFNRSHEVGEVTHVKRHIYSVIVPRGEGGIMHQRREGMCHGIADDRVKTGLWIDAGVRTAKAASQAINAFEFLERNLAWRGTSR